MTKRNELIDILHKCGICIWTLRDGETSKTCLRGIAYENPPIVVVDNDDFKTDMLTGNASCAHWTNVLYVQPRSYEEESNNDSATAQNVTKKEVSKKLNVKCEKLTKLQEYVCLWEAGSEPPVRETVTQSKEGQRSQIVRSIVHALARTSFSGERPWVEQQSIPSYSGFQSCLLPCTRKSKGYYHATYNEPPKKFVIYDVMNKLLDTMKDKSIPFHFW